MVDRLGQDVAQGGSEGSREDEGGPEEEDVGGIGPKIERGEEGEDAAEDERAAFVTERGVIGQAIAERGAEGVRDEDGEPVEGLGFAVGDVVYVDGAEGEIPNREDGEDAGEEDDGTPEVTDPGGAGKVIGGGALESRGGGGLVVWRFRATWAPRS